jgi:hypothetical protein
MAAPMLPTPTKPTSSLCATGAVGARPIASGEDDEAAAAVVREAAGRSGGVAAVCVRARHQQEQ